MKQKQPRWKRFLGSIVPILGTALGGPIGGMASGVLMKALKVNPEDSDAEQQVARLVETASPETLQAIKQAEIDFELEAKKLDIDLESLHAADRTSARDREATLGGWSNPVLAGVVIVGFFVVVGAVLWIDIGQSDSTKVALIGTLVGYVSAKADQVVSYYFGSSSDTAKVADVFRKNNGS